jgi:hypothetical protein
MFSQHDLYTIQDSTLDRCVLYGNDHMTASSIMKDPYFWQHQSIIILIIDNLSAGGLRESYDILFMPVTTNNTNNLCMF